MTVIEAMKKKLPILATYDKFPNGLEGRARPFAMNSIIFRQKNMTAPWKSLRSFLAHGIQKYVFILLLTVTMDLTFMQKDFCM